MAARGICSVCGSPVDCPPGSEGDPLICWECAAPASTPEELAAARAGSPEAAAKILAIMDELREAIRRAKEPGGIDAESAAPGTAKPGDDKEAGPSGSGGTTPGTTAAKGAGPCAGARSEAARLDALSSCLDELEVDLSELQDRVETLESEERQIERVGLGIAYHPLYMFGSAVAVAISWSVNRSIGWAVLHGLMSWLYVIYYGLPQP